MPLRSSTSIPAKKYQPNQYQIFIININITLGDNYNDREMKISVRTPLVPKFWKEDKEGKMKINRGI